jgi:hypothetical protein
MYRDFPEAVAPRSPQNQGIQWAGAARHQSDQQLSAKQEDPDGTSGGTASASVEL